MSENWKPGDVTLVRTRGGVEVAAMRGVDAWHYSLPTLGGFTTNYDRSREIDPVRRLAVVDFENREQVERLAHLVWKFWETQPNSMQAAVLLALREFANPTPPKPDEPQGLGAVVEDAEGRRWVRIEPDGGQAKWLLSQAPDATDPRYVWSAVPAARVLSEGVTP